MKFLERFWFGCEHCHGGQGCPVAEHVDPETGEIPGTAHGLALIALVLLVFVFPLATAVAGAYAATCWSEAVSQTGRDLWQLGGALAGFFVGVGLARIALWVRRWFSPASGGVE